MVLLIGLREHLELLRPADIALHSQGVGRPLRPWEGPGPVQRHGLPGGEGVLPQEGLLPAVLLDGDRLQAFGPLDGDVYLQTRRLCRLPAVDLGGGLGVPADGDAPGAAHPLCVPGQVDAPVPALEHRVEGHHPGGSLRPAPLQDRAHIDRPGADVGGPGLRGALSHLRPLDLALTQAHHAGLLLPIGAGGVGVAGLIAGEEEIQALQIPEGVAPVLLFLPLQHIFRAGERVSHGDPGIRLILL